MDQNEFNKSLWHILGAGSIGCLFAYRFSKSQIPCELLLRDETHLRQYQQAGGITLTQSKRLNQNPPTIDTVFLPARVPNVWGAGSSPYSLRKITHILITTKAHQTDDALQAYSKHIAADATLVFLQNGMRHSGSIRKQFPNATIILGTTTEGANRLSPFNIRHAGSGITWLGRAEWGRATHKEPRGNHSPDLSSTRLPQHTLSIQCLVDLFEQAKFNAKWDPEIETRLWQKLAINCAINAITILYNCPNGKLLTDPEANHLFRLVVDEITHFYEKHLPQSAVNLKQIIYDVTKATETNICSSLQDWRAKRRTEIPFFNGYLIRYADSHNFDLPINKKIMVKLAELNQNAENKPL